MALAVPIGALGKRQGQSPIRCAPCCPRGPTVDFVTGTRHLERRFIRWHSIEKPETVSIRATPPPLRGLRTPLLSKPPCQARLGRAASFCPHSALVCAHSDLHFHQRRNFAGLATSQTRPISPPKPANPSLLLCFQETSGDRVPPEGSLTWSRLMTDAKFANSIHAASRGRGSGRNTNASLVACDE